MCSLCFMNTIQISINCNETQQEILIGLLLEKGAEGFEQMDDVLIAYFNELSFRSYDVKKTLEGFEFNTTLVAEQNWNEVWESNFQPVVLDDFCAVRADFHKPFSHVAYDIIITPKMSFGTGHHATTALMIGQMKSIDMRDKIVLDFGTGTGILSILAEKKGAARIFAIDVDEWSVRNASENILKNNCTKIEVSLTSQIPSGFFDLILANINRNVILQHLDELKSKMLPGGNILISGILAEDEPEILQAIENSGLIIKNRTEQNNWLCFSLTLLQSQINSGYP